MADRSPRPTRSQVLALLEVLVVAESRFLVARHQDGDPHDVRALELAYQDAYLALVRAVTALTDEEPP